MILVTVQGSMQLAAPAAAAWERLTRDVARATGVSLMISSPAGAFRSPEMVLDMWRDPRKYGATKGTAKPRSLGGPGSVHENGLCVDIWNWAAVGTKALDRYAAAHGFRRTIASEPWHYQHNGVMPASAKTTPLDTYDEEILMSNGIRYHYKPASPGSPAEYGIFGAEIPASGRFPGGYEVSTVEATGVVWGRLYGRGDGSPWTADMTRDQWVQLQAEATKRHKMWLEQGRRWR